MNILDIIKTNPNVSFTVSANDLLELVNIIISKTMDEIQQTSDKEKSEEYLTATEVSSILEVSKPTLWRWEKREYLTPIKIGGKRKYLKSEISNLIKK